MAKRNRQHRHHKVERDLPRNLVDELAEQIRAGRTYEWCEAWLADQGYEVGKSSIHRWHRFLRQGLARIRERAQLAEHLVRTVGVDPATVQSAAFQLAIQQAMDVLMRIEGGETEASINELSKLFSALGRLGVSNTQLSRHLAELRERKAEADEQVERMAADGELPQSAIDRIKRIYGIIDSGDDGA